MIADKPREPERGGPANDAHLIQVVRSRLGREKPEVPRLNVSSCGMVITLHGVVEDEKSRSRVTDAVRSVPGVAGVEDKLRCGLRRNHPCSGS